MKKVELLAPAGDLDTLKVAIEAGADAVYLAGKKFGARQFAKNFSDEELKEAVNFAHLRNAKIYVTVNTIIFPSEWEELCKYLAFLYEIKVDAIIVQDLGVLSYVRQTFPNFIVHISTQMNIYDEKSLKLFSDLGVKRVILAREVAINEIKKFTKYDIEIEVFIHGALCYCSSGNCLMSYAIGKRSGNRGLCAQPCRKSYTLIEDLQKQIVVNKPVMSMKDLCTIDQIDELIEARIPSFKIEGRMKNQEYVYTTIKAYRNAIDAYYSAQPIDLSMLKNDMKVSFNRQFTKGDLFNDNNFTITNWGTVNHQGIKLGRVINQTASYIEIKLENSLEIGDALRIVAKDDQGFYVQKMFVNNCERKKANASEVVKLPIRLPKVINCEVLKTKSQKVINELTEYMKLEHQKFPLFGKLILEVNKKAKLSLSDGINEVEVETSEVILNTTNKPQSDEFYKIKLNKLNDTVFYFQDLIIEYDQKAFISLKDLNKLRREAIDLLNMKRLNHSTEFNNNQWHLEEKHFNKSLPKLTVIVHNKEQYDACLTLGITDIYTDYDSKQKNTARLAKHSTDYSMIHNFAQTSIHNAISPYFNVTNYFAIELLKNLGFAKIYLSYELSLTELEKLSFQNLDVNIGIPIYGKMDVMATTHCMIAKAKGYQNKGCLQCLNHQYQLLDEYNNRFNIFTYPSDGCTLRIIDYKLVNLISKIDWLKERGINLFLVTFTTETKEEVIKVLQSIKI